MIYLFVALLVMYRNRQIVIAVVVCVVIAAAAAVGVGMWFFLTKSAGVEILRCDITVCQPIRFKALSRWSDDVRIKAMGAPS
jgi:hypothetical protein